MNEIGKSGPKIKVLINHLPNIVNEESRWYAIFDESLPIGNQQMTSALN